MPKRIDGRRWESKRLQSLTAKFLSGSGGKNPELARAAAGLELRLTILDQALTRGEAVNLNEYTRAVNSLGRTMAALGLSSWMLPKEIKPKTLTDVLNQKDPPNDEKS